MNSKIGNRRLKSSGRGPHFYCTDRDRQILHFLWRWKLASTATIHAVAGGASTPYSTYKTLERLSKHDFIESRMTIEYNFASWCLTDYGFASIKESLGDLCQEGFQSENHWHDRNVLALHLGEWAKLQPPNVSHFTEQQMRRYSLENYPSWVPNLTGHRPDGYTRIASKEKQWLIAFEVEIWAKALSIYETTLRYYDLAKNIDRVFWLVSDPQVKINLLKAKSNINDESKNLHLFIDQHEYMQNGWNSKVTNECMENLGTMRKLLEGMSGNLYGNISGNEWGTSRFPIHYDTRKVLGKKRT